MLCNSIALQLQPVQGVKCSGLKSPGLGYLQVSHFLHSNSATLFCTGRGRKLFTNPKLLMQGATSPHADSKAFHNVPQRSGVHWLLRC